MYLKKNISLGLILSVIALILYTGCKPERADVDSFKTYNKNGLLFKYPGNWKINANSNQEKNITGAVRSVIIETHNNAYYKISLKPAEDSPGLPEYLSEYTKIRKNIFTQKFKTKDYAIIQLRPINPLEISEKFSGREIAGLSEYYGVNTGSNLHKISARHFKLIKKKWAVFINIEDFSSGGSTNDDGFALINNSLEILD